MYGCPGSSTTQAPTMTTFGKRSVQLLATLTTCLVLLCAEARMPTGLSNMPLHIRHKRHLMQLCKTMQEHTPQRSCWDFNGYGCYCGKGSRGRVPVDCVDRCCKTHDSCYDRHQSLLCYPHFVHYSSNCSNGTCQCTDSASKSPCAHGTCECDVVFARCIASCPYNDKYSKMSEEECQKLEEITRPSENTTVSTSNETTASSACDGSTTTGVPRDVRPGLGTRTAQFGGYTTKGTLEGSTPANITPEHTIGGRTPENGTP